MISLWRLSSSLLSFIDRHMLADVLSSFGLRDSCLSLSE
jgi:hypothetical protein